MGLIVSATGMVPVPGPTWWEGSHCAHHARTGFSGWAASAVGDRFQDVPKPLEVSRDECLVVREVVVGHLVTAA